MNSPTPAFFTEDGIFMEFIKVCVQVVQGVLLHSKTPDSLCLHLVNTLDRVFYCRLDLWDDKPSDQLPRLYTKMTQY